MAPVQEVWQTLKRSRSAMFGLVVIFVFVVCSIFAPWIAPEDPTKANLSLALRPPSQDALFGRDELGRDILSRVIHGARISLTIGLIAVTIGALLGTPVGAVSGYYGGKVDLLIQRLIDIMMAFPGILLAIVIVSIMGVGLKNVMLAVGIVSVPTYVRLVRGSVLAIKEQDFVSAAKALGSGDLRIIFRHILPNCLGPLIVQSTLQIATSILWAAGLGFLGLGAQAPTPEWGTMLSRGRLYIWNAYHLTLFPGLAIFLSVLGFNLLGDGLRDALDPRLRGRL
jgi:ABC-type dipeptide/oligopeptide/nickel transport system permease subunit